MENRMSGPHVGQIVHFTGTVGSVAIPGIIYAVISGVASVSTISGGTVTDQGATQWDETATKANSWHYPSATTGI